MTNYEFINNTSKNIMEAKKMRNTSTHVKYYSKNSRFIFQFYNNISYNIVVIFLNFQLPTKYINTVMSSYFASNSSRSVIHNKIT